MIMRSIIQRTANRVTSSHRLNRLAPVVAARSEVQLRTAYGDRIIDHYSNPRNVGVLDKDSLDVGTGLVGAPACGDVMKFQIEGKDGVTVDVKFKVHLASILCDCAAASDDDDGNMLTVDCFSFFFSHSFFVPLGGNLRAQFIHRSTGCDLIDVWLWVSDCFIELRDRVRQGQDPQIYRSLLRT